VPQAEAEGTVEGLNVEIECGRVAMLTDGENLEGELKIEHAR
jgi:hypothetical protein